MPGKGEMDGGIDRGRHRQDDEHGGDPGGAPAWRIVSPCLNNRSVRWTAFCSAGLSGPTSCRVPPIRPGQPAGPGSPPAPGARRPREPAGPGSPPAPGSLPAGSAPPAPEARRPPRQAASPVPLTGPVHNAHETRAVRACASAPPCGRVGTGIAAGVGMAVAGGVALGHHRASSSRPPGGGGSAPPAGEPPPPGEPAPSGGDPPPPGEPAPAGPPGSHLGHSAGAATGWVLGSKADPSGL
jgi:hypothetical protein